MITIIAPDWLVWLFIVLTVINIALFIYTSSLRIKLSNQEQKTRTLLIDMVTYIKRQL